MFRTVDEISSLFSQRATSTALFTHFTGKGQYFANVFNSLFQVDEGKLAAGHAHARGAVKMPGDPVACEPLGKESPCHGRMLHRANTISAGLRA